MGTLFKFVFGFILVYSLFLFFTLSFVMDLSSGKKIDSNDPAVIWFAPFLSSGGYCTEAITTVLSLEKYIPSLRVRQSGDKPDWSLFVENYV